MEDKPRFTSIPVDPETRDRVRERKRGGDSYTDVIERLLNQTSTTGETSD